MKEKHMAKIGTAHVEVKPVLNQEALDRVCQEIEDQVEAAVERALKRRDLSAARSTPPISSMGDRDHEPGSTHRRATDLPR